MVEFNSVTNGVFGAPEIVSFAPPPLEEQRIRFEGIVGLRFLIDWILDSWRQDDDFQIIFSTDGKPGPVITFECPKGHQDYEVEIREVHNREG